MAETKQTTTAKKTTTKRTPKKTTETAQPKTQPEATSNPLLDLLSGLTPDQLANLVALAQNQAQPVQEIIVAEPKKPKKITMSYLNRIRDREVEVRNVVNGRVTFHSQKTGMTYVWTHRDEIEVMTVGEILTMFSKNRKFLTAPWLVVEDAEVNQGLGLEEAIESIEIFDHLDDFLDLPFYQIKEKVNTFNVRQRQQLADHISVKIKEKELRDIVLIQNLQEVLGTEFLTIK